MCCRQIRFINIQYIELRCFFFFFPSELDVENLSSFHQTLISRKNAHWIIIIIFVIFVKANGHWIFCLVDWKSQHADIHCKWAVAVRSIFPCAEPMPLSALSAEHSPRNAHITHRCMQYIQLTAYGLVREKCGVRRCDVGAATAALVRMRRPAAAQMWYFDRSAHTSEAFWMPVLTDAFSLFRYYISDKIWKLINFGYRFVETNYRARKESYFSLVLNNPNKCTNRVWKIAKFRKICFSRIFLLMQIGAVTRSFHRAINWVNEKNYLRWRKLRATWFLCDQKIK